MAERRLEDLNASDFLAVYGAAGENEEPLHRTDETLKLQGDWTNEEIYTEMDIRLKLADQVRQNKALLARFVEAWYVAQIEPPLCTEKEHDDRCALRDRLHAEVLARMEHNLEPSRPG